ncbi:MAG: hypothetical protein PHI83_07775 [Sphaerochaetaceae bacterium]|nr:hypothetical protein [Sphaerochaetaceae bacterium]
MKKALIIMLVAAIGLSAAFAQSYVGVKLTYPGLLGVSKGTDLDSRFGLEGSVYLPIPFYLFSLIDSSEAEKPSPMEILSYPALQAKAVFKLIDTKPFDLSIGASGTAQGAIDFANKGFAVCCIFGPEAEIDIRLGEKVSLNIAASYPITGWEFSYSKQTEEGLDPIGVALFIGLCTQIAQVSVNFAL